MHQGLTERALKTCDWFEKRMDEYEKIFFKNPIFLERSEGIGVLTKEDAIRLGATGTVLRASGVKHDIRRDEPYSAYPDFTPEARDRKSTRLNSSHGSISYAVFCLKKKKKKKSTRR